MSQPQGSPQGGQEAALGVEAGQGHGQRQQSAKNAPITSHAKRDMEAALFMAQKQHAALGVEIAALKAALRKVRDEG